MRPKPPTSFKFRNLFIVTFVLAAIVRTIALPSIPAGQHQDEAWFAYNAFLISETGRNIYGEFLPLTVDMWGDFVSAVHSYIQVPFIWLLGNHIWSHRLPFAAVSLFTMIVMTRFLYRLTHNHKVSLLFALLFATSQWSIIMTRAASSVIIDSLVTLLFLTSSHHLLTRPAFSTKTILRSILIIWALSITAYFTYFTSRLTLPLLLIALTLFLYAQKKLTKPTLIISATSFVLYCIFPFFVMLNTPFALGRYEETTILNSRYSQAHLFQNITQSGQAGIPPLITRAFFNKLTQNFWSLLYNASLFASPSILLFESTPPIRYAIPQSGVMNLIEYLGFLMAIFGGLASLKRFPILSKTALFMASCALIGLIPAVLTIDDTPNLQRAVFALPYLQAAAALGLYLLYRQHKAVLLKIPNLPQALLILGISISFIPFLVHYFFHSPFYTPHYRSRSGEKVADWILSQPSDTSYFLDQDEANFIYPYLRGSRNLLEEPILKEQKHFLTTPSIQIGSNMMIRELCSYNKTPELLATLQPDFVIVRKNQDKPECFLPGSTSLITSIAFDDDLVDYHIYSFDPRPYLSAKP